MEIYSAKNLSFYYPESVTASLTDVDFSCNEGDFVLLFGRSGCGKTTLLRHLKSVLTPKGRKSGEIFFMNKPLSDSDTREQSTKIGFVSQSPENQIVCDKVWHELAFGLESLGFVDNIIRSRVAEMASFFGIEDLFYANTSELSGGQKQLINLASVMVMHPKVLILDEPTSQLDPIAAGEFLNTLARINREFGIAVIISEHRLDEVIPVATKLCFMDNGRIKYSGSVREVSNALRSDKDAMIDALPAGIRIWNALNIECEAPVSVNEAQRALYNYSKEHSQRKFEIIKTDKREKCVVSAKDIWFRYEKNSRDVVKNFNFELYKGELCALLGGNGAGKSTVLKLLCGVLEPYRGNIEIDKDIRIAYLPQDVRSLFVRKTVYEEILDGVSDKKNMPGKDRIKEIISICRLENLLNRHPFDLSGGEAQRTALAKALINSPSVLLLDEPTKALDAEFKRELAYIFEDLCSAGISILMVSHDVEFCASHAQRCALFFDGAVTSISGARDFFIQNYFYTTAACRISRDIVELAVSVEDVLSAFVEVSAVKPRKHFCYTIEKAPTEKKVKENKKIPIWRKLLFSLSFLLTVILCIMNIGIIPMPEFISGSVYMPYITMFASVFGMCIATASRSRPSIDEAYVPQHKRKLAKRTIVACAMILLAIPATVLFGVYYLGDAKYLFISLLVMIESMLPFFLVFEGKKPQARELVLIAVLCTIAIAAREVFYVLPQFKPVLAFVIISAVALGPETGFLVGSLTMLVSNVMFSQGQWTPWQMFATGIIGFIAGFLYKKGLLSRNRLSLTVFGFIVAIVIYGGIMNPAAAIMARVPLNKATLISYYATGFPMDIVHAVSTAVFLWLCAEPLLEKLDRVKIKYGLL